MGNVGKSPNCCLTEIKIPTLKPFGCRVMFNISLRLPYLIYLSVVCIFLGVLIAPLFREVPEQTTSQNIRDHALMHGSLEIPAEGAPEVAVEITKDPVDGWNMTVLTENFTFTPNMVNSVNVVNTGHAHLYINDVKIARLYSPYFHIPDLAMGDYEISVNLSTNDHSYYVINGEKIESRVVITQDTSVLSSE
jgi:hypothetical protein